MSRLSADVRQGINRLASAQYALVSERQRLDSLRSGNFYRDIFSSLFDNAVITQERYAELIVS